MIYGPEVTFTLPDAKVEAYRRSVLHLNLISVVDGSTFNWCEQNVLRKLMREDVLFAKIAQPDMTASKFNNHLRVRMGEADRGHLEMFPKLWSWRPYDKMNSEITKILD